MATRKQIGWMVPGFGLSLRWPLFQPKENTLLLSALDASEEPGFCYTVRERTMLALINELTDMPDWYRKVFDSDFALEWKNEKLMTGEDVTRSMADWCIEEVRDYVQDFCDSGIVPAIDGGVIKSDFRNLSLLTQLNEAVNALRTDTSKRLNHAEVVVDVVDPYLFPFAWEKTRMPMRDELTLLDCISRCGKGETVKMPPEEDCVQKDSAKYPNDMAWSRRFQYLPFDVQFDNRGEGGSRIISYINNVHPTEHKRFYSALEKFIDATIPLFNQTLIDLKAPGYSNQRFDVAVLGRRPEVTTEPGNFRPPQQRAYANWLNPQGRFQDWLFVDLKKEFWNIGLQLILRVREISLTPSKPCYPGEDWHIEGQMNERICATLTYTYSTHNTNPAILSFRRRIDAEGARFAKDCILVPPWAPELYGARSGDPVIQHMGDVVLREGRAVVHPNTFQTRLLPFELADKGQPGHVKLLTLYLVDPNRRMMSTAMVPPQQREWWAREVRAANARFWRLPLEVWDLIVEMVEGCPMGRREAEEIRREFREERARAQAKHTRAMMEYLEWDLDWDSERDE